MKRTRKGFTLVELLIVISIIAVLAAAMSMSSKDATAKAKASKIVSDFRTIAAAVSVYISDSKDTLPTTAYFKAHSDDYLFNGKMGSYSVTSDDTDTTVAALGKKWYVEYTPTPDAGTLDALSKISADVGLIGTKKMRIN